LVVTSLNVAVSIPDEVIRFFQFTYSFQPHYDPEVDSALTEMSTMNLPKGKGRLARKDDLTTIRELTV
jgi:hypothetical protein